MTHKIAIIGAGPSGCFLAQALGKSCPDAQITIIDQMPVPYGLVRYGVAADHQGTKAVVRQFARLFEKQGVVFAGNLCIGDDGSGDLTYGELQDMFDVVVLATGLSQDRRLGLSGENLPQVYGSGRVTRYWNDHPDDQALAPEFGRQVVVVGNGNVAIDVVRILAKGARDFEGSDFDGSRVVTAVDEIHIVGRSAANLAKFDAVMVRELAKIQGLAVRLDAPLKDVGDDKRLMALSETVLAASPDAPQTVLTFHFGWAPEAVCTDQGAVSGVVFQSADGASKTLDCDSIVTAIGFDDTRRPFDGDDEGAIGNGLYCAGWFKRGPRGTIPENRQDSQKVAQRIAADIAGLGTDINKSGQAALYSRFGKKIVTYRDWLAIDSAEQAAAPEGRCRMKLKTVEDMLHVVNERRTME
jgi:ferredoxin--NADP+ reductase